MNIKLSWVGIERESATATTNDKLCHFAPLAPALTRESISRSLSHQSWSSRAALLLDPHPQPSVMEAFSHLSRCTTVLTGSNYVLVITDILEQKICNNLFITQSNLDHRDQNSRGSRGQVTACWLSEGSGRLPQKLQGQSLNP